MPILEKNAPKMKSTTVTNTSDTVEVTVMENLYLKEEFFLFFIDLVIFEWESLNLNQASHERQLPCLSLSSTDVTAMYHDHVQGLTDIWKSYVSYWSI